ncbi:MAG: hypothetical protein HY290_17910 [Planctomycetia bacterium]|nr:hypothetical protein [Planctomycetia bacterium]
MQAIRPVYGNRRTLMQGLPNILLRRTAIDFERSRRLLGPQLKFNERLKVFRDAAHYIQSGSIFDALQ